MTPQRRVPIRPRVGVFGVFEAVDYKAWYALAEFVDNSIQSHRDATLDGRLYGDVRLEPLRINIEVEGGPDPYIRVTDSAGGISDADFARAFEIGSPPPDPSGLSVYGIGMKSAAAWFAGELVVTSSCLGETVQRSIRFDFPKIIADGLEALDVEEQATDAYYHGTEVLLTQLRHPLHTATHTKVRDHLTSIYRNFLRDERLVLTYRGERLRYRDPEILVAPRWRTEGPDITWRKDIECELSTGERVHGFAAIRKTGRASGSGFSLYRQGRVITGLDDDPWRPTSIFGFGNSYRSQRLFGELHLENVKVAYSKNGFIWQASEEELIERLKDALDDEPLPLLRQAEGYRSREPEPRQRSAARRALSGTAGAIAESVQADLPLRVEDQPTDGHVPAEVLPPAGQALASRELSVNFRGQAWLLVVELTEDPDADWLSLADSVPPAQRPQEARRVGIRMNINTRFMRRFGGAEVDDMEALLRLGAAIALAVIVGREQAMPFADYLLLHINKLLRGSLSR